MVDMMDMMDRGEHGGHDGHDGQGGHGRHDGHGGHIVDFYKVATTWRSCNDEYDNEETDHMEDSSNGSSSEAILW